MSKNQVIGLKSIDLSAKISLKENSLPIRSSKKRIFTDEEWSFLNTLSDQELRKRIRTGDRLIGILSRPEMMNMTPKSASLISSNLRFQQEAIQDILKGRKKNGRR